jgi:hypothetical protein
MKIVDFDRLWTDFWMITDKAMLRSERTHFHGLDYIAFPTAESLFMKLALPGL